jgi:hypothetical protein
MSGTQVSIAVRDPNSPGGPFPEVDAVEVTNSGSNPPAGKAGRQTVSLGDGNDNFNLQSVDSDGAAHVIAKRIAAYNSKGAVSASTSAVSLIGARANRNGLSGYNTSPSTAYIGFASTIVQPSAGGTDIMWPVASGAPWELPYPYEGALWIIFDDATSGGFNFTDY